MLPKKGTKVWDDLVKWYISSTPEERDKKAGELGYKNRHNFQGGMAVAGVKLYTKVNPCEAPSPQALPPTDQLPPIILPPVELKKYEPINSGRVGDPETMCLHLTDFHYGEITASYNSTVASDRLDHLFKSTMHIATLHRNMYPVNDLEILITGDMVHGENVYQGAKVGTITEGARDQISGALKLLAEFTLSLKENFLTVNVRCNRGNHGRYSREAPSTSNWDMMLYDQLKLKLEPYKINVQVANEFYLITDIQGFRFFQFHGDQFKATQGIPWFAMGKGIPSWWWTYGGFDYAVGGHFHSDHYMRLNSKTKLFLGGAFPTDDTFTQEIVKTSSIPCQWVWGVHKRKGVTWHYSLVTDDKYLPKGNQE